MTAAAPDRPGPVRGHHTALFTALALGALALGLSLWHGRQWDRQFARMLPLMDHLNEAKGAVAEGYAWVEAHLRGEPAAGEEAVAEAFARATEAATRALETRAEGPLAGRLADYRDAIQRTAVLARERAALHTGGDAARLRDLQLFAALHGLDLMARTIDQGVHRQWRAILDEQRALQRWSLGGWVLVVGAACVALLASGRRRARAEAMLAAAHRDLERRVADRTREVEAALASLSLEVDQRRRAQRELARSAADLRALSAELIAVQEAERERLAHTLHDEITQNVGAVKYRVELIRARLLEGDAAAAAEACDQVVEVLQDTLEGLRTTYMELRPAHLDELGLGPALRWLCREFERRSPGLRVDLAFAWEDGELGGDLRVTAYRIVQECLEQVGSRGAAAVRVALGRADGALELLVEDDGEGIPAGDTGPDGRPRGVGLRTVGERARSTGGTAQVDTPPGAGSRVRVTWPRAGTAPAGAGP